MPLWSILPPRKANLTPPQRITASLTLPQHITANPTPLLTPPRRLVADLTVGVENLTVEAVNLMVGVENTTSQ
jgi:hypothetical protein